MTQRFRLHSMPSAQCYVAIQHDSVSDRTIVELTSYSTLVLSAILDSDKSLRLLCSGTYSTTTARHINRFTTEFFGENLYHYCKRVVNSPDCFANERIAFGMFYTVFKDIPGDSKYYKHTQNFNRAIECYENDSFGYGAVKPYRGHY